MQIEIKIEPTFSFSWPMVKINVNKHMVFDGLCKPNYGKHFVQDIELENPMEKNTLSIEHYDKKGKETVVNQNGDVLSDRAIILKSIKIDGNEIPEVILYDHDFIVNWSKQQLKDNIESPNTIKNNLYFGYNGVYNYYFSNDSRKDYFRNLIEKERLANISNKQEMTLPSGEVVEVFEFTGKLVDSNQKEAMTISELYEKVKNES